MVSTELGSHLEKIDDDKERPYVTLTGSEDKTQSLKAKQMDTIKYHNHEYPLRIVNIPGWMNGARISITSLNDDLMNRDGSYVDDEGREVDESIFFYVEEQEFNLPEKDLIEIITRHLT